jgi:hypothetical protein
MFKAILICFGTLALGPALFAQGGCNTATYILSGSSQLGTKNNFQALGGATYVQLSTPAGCQWTISNVPSWINIPNGTTGTATTADPNDPTRVIEVIQVVVMPNVSGPARNQTLVIGGRAFTVSQAGNYQPKFGLQNQDTNAVSVWLMTGAGNAAIAQAPVVYTAAPNWRVAAMADFDADGITDLVLQNQADGRVSIWYMGGNAGLSLVSAPVIYTALPGWNVVAAADFDNNGVPDLVLQNQTTYDVSFWYLTSSAQLAASPIIGRPIAGWRVAGAADFDGNGTPDLVLQNTTSNGISIWYMTGQYGYIVLSPPYIATALNGWKIVATAYLDANTTPDLVLQNTATNEISYWYMSGANGSAIGTAPIVGASVARWSMLSGN